MDDLCNREDIHFIDVFDKEVLDFLARRHDTSVERIICQFLKQSDIEKNEDTDYGFALEANEVEIMRDYYLRGVPEMSMK